MAKIKHAEAEALHALRLENWTRNRIEMVGNFGIEEDDLVTELMKMGYSEQESRGEINRQIGKGKAKRQ